MSRDAIHLQTDSRHRSDVLAFARSRLGFEPDPDQARAIDAFIRTVHQAIHEPGSRIVGLPGREDTIRGFSRASLLLVDEVSRVPDALYLALRPMIVANPNARIWLISAPNGRGGFFHEVRRSRGHRQGQRRHTAICECDRVRVEAAGNPA